MNKIILDGKEYELSAELVEKIKAEVAAQEKAENPFERSVGEHYCFADASGWLGYFIDSDSATDNALYSAGNYCRDKGLMEQRALHETLNRLLWRYSEMHGGDSSWETTENQHHCIYNGFINGISVYHACGAKQQGTVYFKDEDTAEVAIEEVVKPFMAEHPEFVW